MSTSWLSRFFDVGITVSMTALILRCVDHYKGPPDTEWGIAVSFSLLVVAMVGSVWAYTRSK